MLVDARETGYNVNKLQNCSHRLLPGVSLINNCEWEI